MAVMTQRWTSLGHAGWLVEAGGLRLLFDPLLGDTLHGGVHVVHPPRRIDIDGLRPDMIVISHVHPDHFDVPSLARLARRYPDVPVLTADPLVASSCRRLGFRTASVLPDRKQLAIGGLTLWTTPSKSDVQEWGMVVDDGHTRVWNQVDSVTDAADCRGLRDATGGIGLVVAQWSPLREIEAVTGGSLGFPTAPWADKLASLAALGAPTVCPAAAGFRHADPFAWRDAHVFPVTEAMLARDLATIDPMLQVLPCPIGATLVADGPHTTCVDSAAFVERLEAPEAPPWTPFHLPPVSDPDLGHDSDHSILAEVEPWLADALLPAIRRRAPRLGRPLLLDLDLVLPTGRVVVHFDADGDQVTLRRGEQVRADHDAVVVAAGSMFADVVAGRRHWGEPLLAGVLRSARRLPVLPAFFPYWALPYRRSVERWTDHLVAQALEG
jgi:hypothetical protein